MRFRSFPTSNPPVPISDWRSQVGRVGREWQFLREYIWIYCQTWHFSLGWVKLYLHRAG